MLRKKILSRIVNSLAKGKNSIADCRNREKKPWRRRHLCKKEKLKNKGSFKSKEGILQKQGNLFKNNQHLCKKEKELVGRKMKANSLKWKEVFKE